MGGRNVILGMAAVLTVAAGGLVWLGVPDPAYMHPDEDPVLAGTDKTTPSVLSSRPASRPTDPSKDSQPGNRTQLRLLEEHDWRVRIHAFRGRDQRFAHARLRVVIYPGFEAAGEALHTKVFTTNADGEATCRLPTPTETVTIQVRSANSEVVARPVVSVVPVGEEPPLLKVHLLPLDHVLLGVVMTQSGKPVPKARVSWAQTVPPIYTNEQGRFRLRVSSAYGSLRYYVVAPGYSRFQEILQLEGPGTTNVEVRLKPGLRVFGKVTDTEGLPLEGVEVSSFWVLYTGERTLTDAEGNYELDTFDIDRRSHYVVARLEGYVRARVRAKGSSKEARADVTLKRAPIVTGTVFGPDGRPVAGASVGISSRGRPTGRGTVLTRENGRFELRNQAKGKPHLWTYKRGFAIHRLRIQPPADGATVDLQVHLQRGHFVAGRVVDNGGQPIEGVRLYAFQDRYVWLRVDATTDAEGRYRIEDLPALEPQAKPQKKTKRSHPKGLWLYVTTRGYLTERKQDVVLDSENVDIVLQRSMVLRGRVVDGRTGAPIQDFRIRALKGSGLSWRGKGQRFQNTDGYWETKGQRIKAGAKFDLEATADGYAPTVLQNVTATANMSPDSTVFKLSPGVALSGQVLDLATGRPLIGAKINLLRPGQSRPRPGRGGDKSKRSSADGSFRFENVAAGSVLLAVEHDGRPPFLHGPLTVPALGTMDRVVVLVSSGGSIEGVLVDPNNRSVANVKVTLQPSHLSRTQLWLRRKTIRTQANGSFRFEGLVNTDYVLYATSEGQDGVTVAFRTEVRVRNDGPTRVVLTQQGACSVSGTVSFLGQAGTKVRIQLYRKLDVPGGKTKWQTFGAGVKAGRFTVRGLPEGTYKFATVYRLDGKRRTHNGPRDVVVQAGTQNQVSIQIPPR